MYASVHSFGLMGLLFLQSLLRSLLPDSFPARLAAEPTTEKQRRFIIIDENVYATYGEQLEQVWWLFYLFPLHVRHARQPLAEWCLWEYSQASFCN